MSSRLQDSLTDKNSIRCLVGSVFIALGSGTVYCYSYYNSQLFINCQIPLDQISKLSLSLSIGSSLLGLVVGPMIDKFGCNKMSYFGGVETFIGYFILLKNYRLKQDCNVFSICIALVMIGMGSISGFYSCVKCVTYNFPNSRGLAGSIPVSCYALSSLVFSTFFKFYVKNNIELVFETFMIACSIMICFGGYLIFMKDYDKIENKPIYNNKNSSNSSSDILNDLNSIEHQTSSVTKPIAIKKQSRTQSFTKELQGSLKFWGLGKIRETPESAIEHPNMPLLPNSKYRTTSTSFADLNQANQRDSILSTRLNNDSAPPSPLMNAKPAVLKTTSSNGKDRDVVSFDLENANHESISPVNTKSNAVLQPTKTTLIQHSSTRDLPIYKTLTNWKFIGYYIILALLQGIGQTYIYSVGFIVQLLAGNNDEVDVVVDTAAIQSVQVSLIAIFSFAGRLLSGPLSDKLVMKKAQRKWNIVVSCCALSIASFSLTHFNSFDLNTKLHWLNLCSCIFAFGFGIVFGTYPAVIVDAFGTELFSSIWGIITTGGLITVKLFSKSLSIDLEKDNCEELGNKCVLKTFNITLYSSMFAMSITLVMIYLKFKKRRERLSKYNQYI
ncbi:MFS general substrate transporter [Hanseniaspora valbyensis NRRL Y-1626]|uniref:MFS general substrate transporter n=1 Tax=Hanseniaspora valbyensis NRRL Y-1626 TaxID=766949 RepID=A0A1B7TDM3_9ASCO|nr:MFS general substrate transporter [Hanseniaspora valbyensis NRRL Y-1626]